MEDLFKSIYLMLNYLSDHELKIAISKLNSSSDYLSFINFYEQLLLIHLIETDIVVSIFVQYYFQYNILLILYF